MYAPRVFISMLGTLIVFAIATYSLTNSLSTTLIETVICAVLLQIGYFLGVLYLVWKERKSRDALLNEDKATTTGQEESKVGGLSAPNLNRSEPFNP
ncbi:MULTISPECIES: exopolysaccharide production repressor protein [unclassified Rhizobium]|jgi:exopolysaccharide production repressor protein|uniref:exopolysaccharide production repressor protein n=1 Tax=unclassified Rhizobium TaxID=2613769 RepID=UPI0006483958|nr:MULTISPECIES: exopolysaccharide production repressor protein [unclassified Rhizobium]MBN8952528.1 exopolysaccharide production repressor protein [Rhizobium tropici]OJY64592.1 MAG: exopolysaccharide production repressor exox [Rhizobium sp. 60-20]RKD72552.1 exopolysaccharide production repressor protein [Rhizobium sp. WW_1]